MLRPGTFIARVAALGILGIVLLAVYQFGVEPLMRAYDETDGDMERAKDLLERYRALAAERPALEERLTAFEEDEEALSGYLEGPSDALAAAELQDLAAEAIEAAGGEIRSTQILQATDVEDDPSVRRTGVKLRFASTIDGLAAALYDLETIEPHLFIDQMLVVSDKRAGRNIQDDDDQPGLDIRMDIFGYVRHP